MKKLTPLIVMHEMAILFSVSCERTIFFLRETCSRPPSAPSISHAWPNRCCLPNKRDQHGKIYTRNTLKKSLTKFTSIKPSPSYTRQRKNLYSEYVKRKKGLTKFASRKPSTSFTLQCCLHFSCNILF